MISIATDCSGIDAPIQALKQLKIPYVQEWYCDIDQFARQTAEANYTNPKPKIIYTDMLTRNNKKLPHVDIYVCGFPCQSFSFVGKRLGTKDPRSGVIPKMLETIHYSKPKICILENVRGFMNIENGKPCKDLVDFLKKENYSVSIELYNTKDYGIPQNRERVYIVAIHNSYKTKDYIKPKYKKMSPFEDFILDKNIRDGKIQYMYEKNLHKLKENTHIITPHNFFSALEEVSNTLDTTSQFHYLVKYNRPLLVQEALLLQGFPKNFKQVVTNRQIFKQIGNTMSVNVLKEIIKKALLCIEIN